MEISKKYPNIDMQLTGLLLEFYIRASGISVKEIQELSTSFVPSADLQMDERKNSPISFAFIGLK